MLQNRLSVAGIATDLAGFLLLLGEWWLAFFHETAVLNDQPQRTFQPSMRRHQQATASDQMRGHFDTFARMQDETADRNARGRHMATLSSRKRVFVLATVLIIAGARTAAACRADPGRSLLGPHRPWLRRTSFASLTWAAR